MTFHNYPRKQSGVALFVALILLLIMTMIGISASTRSTSQERMAANTHLTNMTFSASESAIGAFMLDANTGDKLTDGHVLNDLRLGIALTKKVLDEDGVLVTTGYLDNNEGSGQLVASIEPVIENNCDKTCDGFSFGGDVACRYYKLQGKGELTKDSTVIKTTETTLWAREITTCDN